jgi:hypothetical protein
MPSQKLLAILDRTENELREFIKEELPGGSYADIAWAARVADTLAQFKAATGAQDVAGAGFQPIPTDGSSERPSSAKRRPAKDYPLFARDGDKLLKTAWSKRERAEYEHRAPRRVVELLIGAILKKKGEGRKFEATDLLPIRDPDTRQEVPSYQSYMALAWLRSEGLITKKGRNGYLLKTGGSSAERVEQLWTALPIK